MRHFNRVLRLGAALLGGLLLPAVAAGQDSGAESQPVSTPSVLIILDSSGSMDFTSVPDTVPSVCVNPSSLPLSSPPTYLADNERTRMMIAKEALTGTVANRFCAADGRTTSGRIDTINGARPQGFQHSLLCSYDANPTTSDCDPAQLPASQASNGLLDDLRDTVNFGFMTYDSFPESATDSSGMWSYGNANTTSGGATIPCASGTCVNLGVRRLSTGASDSILGPTIPPLNPTTDTLAFRQANNLTVQGAILESIPYWSTPIAAALEDTVRFYTGPAAGTGICGANACDYSLGQPDPLVDCRDRNVILITDGEDSCESCYAGAAASGSGEGATGCEGYWYDQATAYAADLADMGIDLYVVAFNVSGTGLIFDAIAEANKPGRKAFIANTQDELRFQLSAVLSSVLAGEASRVAPLTTTRTAEYRTAGTIGTYNMLATSSVHSDSPYWTGEVVRRQFGCAGTTLEEDLGASMLFSTWLDGLDASELRTDRKLYTPQPQVHGCGLPNRESLFADTHGLIGTTLTNGTYGVSNAEIVAACSATGLPGSDVTVAAACTDLTDGVKGIGITLTEENTMADSCLTELRDVVTQASANYALFHVANATEAELVTDWTFGQTISELWQNADYRAPLEMLLPASIPLSDAGIPAANDRQSRLGDIFHSTPEVVGAPDPELDFSVAYRTFAETVASRPTMLYANTNDGLLHAFNTETGEEAWALTPASLLPKLKSTLSGHALTMDGSPVAQDVRVYRGPTESSFEERWKTVLVTGYRGGGRGYTAMDVSDPLAPKFLWELDSELDPQLGFTFGEPALGTVFIGDCTATGASCEKGVAILPGGLPSSGVAGYSGTRIGRVLYVVELETGKVLRRFDRWNDSTGDEQPFPAPFSGSMAAFDVFADSSVSRAFVGDAAGNMWRIDMSSTDLTQWKVTKFFDPVTTLELYSSGSGEPDPGTLDFGAIFYRPTIALRRSDGRAVVVFGYGNVDDLRSVDAEKNYVVSVVEKPIVSNVTGLVTGIEGDLNWMLELAANEKVSARPRIFDETAYFATFLPETGSASCSMGKARVYGIDYQGTDAAERHVVDTIDRDVTFVPRLKEAPLDPTSVDKVPFWESGTVDASVIPENSIVYSLDITRPVSCYESSAVSDPFGGSRVRLGGISDAGWSLQIGASGQTAASDTAASAQASSQTNIGLDTQKPLNSFPTSWGVIVE